MKLKTIYELAVKKGLKEDLRTKKEIEEVLKKARSEYRKAKGVDKSTFDRENLKQPYADTRLLYGSDDLEVKNVMVGVDIHVSEILLADRLREKGMKVDLVISHHPSGKGLAQLHKVMAIQPGLWQKYGFGKEAAEGFMKSRMEEVFRGVSAGNNTRTVDAARILNIPFMCTHTVADNCVTSYLQKLFDQRKPKKLKNVLSMLKNIPEYRLSMENSASPYILIGEEKNEAGKIFVDMTGGTSPPDKIYGRLAQAGVKTIVSMHCKESNFKIAKTEYINYIIAGHISSDILGLNLMFDEIEKRGKLNFIECSGFKRFRR